MELKTLKAISDDDTELQADTKTVQTKNEEEKYKIFGF